MDNFSGKLAVVTGGGSGMGRELVRQLTAEGCDVALCDVSQPNMDETVALASADAPGVKITTHLCDVADESAVIAFRDAVVDRHATDHVELVFNNAGLSGGGSMITDSRESWDRCFAVCWGGVYFGTRAFLPLLIAAEAGHLINTSSVNGFWASLGPGHPHTAYSSAKFAVKGFTEALINDLRLNAPHVKVSLVMPGHIGTSIIETSLRYGANPDMTDEETELFMAVSKEFEANAPMSASEAATVILDAVREERWRVLVGDDAVQLDADVRANPEHAYDGLALDTITGLSEDS